MKTRRWIWLLCLVPIVAAVIWVACADHEARFKDALWPVLVGYLEEAR